MIAHLLLWEDTHRTIIYGVIALSLWIGAWYTYLKTDIRNFFIRRRAHRWSVDMESKQVTAGPKPVV